MTDMCDPQGISAVADPVSKPVIRTFKELRGFLREDLAVSDGRGSPGFRAVATYRLGVWSKGIENRLLRKPVRLIYRLLRSRASKVYGIELSDSTYIGRRFRVVHQHGIVIHPEASIGDDCLVRQGVTIGAVSSQHGRRGAPRLGNRVWVGAGAMLVGPIRIGDDVIIGPNAVVMTNVPAGAIVSSPQSRIVAPPPRRKPSE